MIYFAKVSGQAAAGVAGSSGGVLDQFGDHLFGFLAAQFQMEGGSHAGLVAGVGRLVVLVG